MSLEQEMDKISFELLSKNNPQLVENIKQSLAAGLTAKKLEKMLFKEFGKQTLTVILAAGAAHYLEGQNETPES